MLPASWITPTWRGSNRLQNWAAALGARHDRAHVDLDEGAHAVARREPCDVVERGKRGVTQREVRLPTVVVRDLDADARRTDRRRARERALDSIGIEARHVRAEVRDGEPRARGQRAHARRVGGERAQGQRAAVAAPEAGRPVGRRLVDDAPLDAVVAERREMLDRFLGRPLRQADREHREAHGQILTSHVRNPPCGGHSLHQMREYASGRGGAGTAGGVAAAAAAAARLRQPRVAASASLTMRM